MKIALAIVFVVALCSHVSVVTCAPSSAPALTGVGVLAPSLTVAGTVTTTTKKPWTQKFKDGLGTFFQGAAVIGAVQQGIQNSRSHKHKPSPAASLAPAAKH